ncbi:MAG: hypothetical protein JOZ26_24590 [Hyphomicrobiales bacterium]|nr:hypothetical protein [Hyphomicrobiales bacterium]
MDEPDQLDRTHGLQPTRQDEGLAFDTLQAGDLVFTCSTPSQTSWEKDGEKRYGYPMAVTELKHGEGGPESADSH